MINRGLPGEVRGINPFLKSDSTGGRRQAMRRNALGAVYWQRNGARPQVSAHKGQKARSRRPSIKWGFGGRSNAAAPASAQAVFNFAFTRGDHGGGTAVFARQNWSSPMNIRLAGLSQSGCGAECALSRECTESRNQAQVNCAEIALVYKGATRAP